MYAGLLKQNRTFRLSEGTRLSMENIHHHVHQFVDGTRNLWRLGRNLLCRTSCTVVSGTSNSLAEVRMDSIKERLNACLTLSMFSANVLGRPLLTVSSTDPVSINFLCHRRIDERDGGYFPCLVLYLR